MLHRNVRDAIRDFNIAFDRPVNTQAYTPTVEERILLGRLLLEETIETLTLGLGLTLTIDNEYDLPGELTLEHVEGQLYDPVETADGQGDVNVVNHFMAHWLGFNLDKVTLHINESNMSKLAPCKHCEAMLLHDGEDCRGTPIINGVTPGYRDTPKYPMDGQHREPGFDPAKPVGKILKSSRYWDAKPGIPAILKEGNY